MLNAPIEKIEEEFPCTPELVQSVAQRRNEISFLRKQRRFSYIMIGLWISKHKSNILCSVCSIPKLIYKFILHPFSL
jgi:hypothetical protein